MNDLAPFAGNIDWKNGVPNTVGGVIAPTLVGIAADHFGLQAAVWTMVCLPLLAAAVALGLTETAPRRRREAAPSDA
jgi:ACS family hexuronate transporter-like MFS transporter